MKFPRFFVAFTVLFLVVGLCGVARAGAPVLTPLDPFPTECQPGVPVTFRLLYTDLDGDLPQALLMVIETPSGEVKISPTSMDGTDPAQGITLNWTYTPANNGTYRYAFTAVSRTGGHAQFPLTDVQLQFTSLSMTMRLGIFIGGLLVALLAIPFIVYAGARATHRRGDPSTAARIALLVGVLASFGLFWYLFAAVYHALGLVIAAVVSLAVLIGLFTRR